MQGNCSSSPKKERATGRPDNVQGLLAAHVLFAGGIKPIAPVDALAVMSPFPRELMRAIGVCAVPGAVGSILPWAPRIRREPTPLAAN